MKCFLHIGTEKTATTTIQKFFDTNRGNILKKGFIYTKSAGCTNNRALAVAAYNSNRRDDFTRDYGIYSDNDLRTFQQRTIESLEEEVEAVKSDDAIIIFSSEHFQSRLTRLEEIERLREIICSLGITDIAVIVYLRRPADIANSMYSTVVKAGSCMEAPLSPKNDHWNNVCNHKNTIEKFSAAFGDDAIIPRIFEKSEFVNGSIVEDIVHLIGIPDDQSYKIPDNANESLTVLGIKLLRHLNKSIPRYIDDKPNPLRANLALYIERHFSSGDKYIMPGYLYEEYEREFKDSNNWVKEKYFPERKNLFSTKIPDEANVNVSSDAETEVIADFIANMWNDKQGRILELRRR
ncbi:MAG: hypothetical protein LJE69_03315 [Thiohalocapsa sp.]|uniref:hypothetical protein n=1 Tax=Thiohalocapsa sp. TaxID=2497641 RepID=UPI0025CC8DCB|nr:hypothetical protein [Thiohalocapsa sp.]MCG6940264.1 hypothetical protein [Thiohalocapsa sp.]